MKFLQAMDQFLDEFGHREVHMDILYPTWCDDPEPVIRSFEVTWMLMNHRAHTGSKSA